LRIVSAGRQVTVVDQVALVTPEPANNASATVLEGNELEALSDNPDDLINELVAIAGPGAGPGGPSIFIDGFSTGQAPSKESIRTTEGAVSPEGILRERKRSVAPPDIVFRGSAAGRYRQWRSHQRLDG
jgi:hypothetical protein